MNFEVFFNSEADPAAISGSLESGYLPIEYHRSLPGYVETQLVDVPTVAAKLGVRRVLLKDESWRLNLPSFKMLGASWATAYAVSRAWLQSPLPESDLTVDRLRTLITNPGSRRLVAATDGNHGRGVARMASLLGVGCIILVPSGMAKSRIQAIESEGATVRVIAGSYDDAIAESARMADSDNLVVSDTSWPGYEDIPAQVIRGYSTLFTEIEEQVAQLGEDNEPTLVALQAGVGAFAAAGIRHYKRPNSTRRTIPEIVIVEPSSADCILRSVKSGHVSEAPGPHGSSMAGLNCGLPSLLALPVLKNGGDIFVCMDDDYAYEAMNLLADAGVVAGESGAAGLGGLLALRAGKSDNAERAGLTPDAVVLLVNTEGATDPENYERVVGKSAELVVSTPNLERS